MTDEDSDTDNGSSKAVSLDDLIVKGSKSKQLKAAKLKIRADGSAKGITAILGANKILFDENGESVANPLLSDEPSDDRKRKLKTISSSAADIAVKMEEYAKRVKARYFFESFILTRHYILIVLLEFFSNTLS